MKLETAAAWLLVPAVSSVAAATPRRAAVVDARALDAPAADRKTAEDALAHRPDLTVVTAPALVGVLDLAQIPAASPDCTQSWDAALVTWLSLRPLADVKEPVTRLLARQLVCADGAGDRGSALAAARRLSALGTTGGVPADVWSRYPAVDATVDVLRQPLTVTSGDGAAISVDLAPVAGTTVTVSAGHRLVAASLGERAAATFVNVKEDRATKVELALPPPPETQFAPVRDAVNALRRGGDDVLAVAKAARLDLVVVLRADGATAFARDGEVMRPLGSAHLGDGPALVAVLPLPAAPDAEPHTAGRSPWTYVIAAGAAAAAVGLVVLATSSGSSTQRIEVKWP